MSWLITKHLIGNLSPEIRNDSRENRGHVFTLTMNIQTKMNKELSVLKRGEVNQVHLLACNHVT